MSQSNQSRYRPRHAAPSLVRPYVLRAEAESRREQQHRAAWAAKQYRARLAQRQQSVAPAMAGRG